jgi:diguanylate cyclase (GGDEF)-like protein
MLDIDYFKNINDTHGHRTGDMVLKELAMLIKSTVRKSDIVARYGGEEFAIILANTDIAGATYDAERIRKNVEAHKFKAVPRIEVTMSLGVAAYPHKEIDTGGDLVARADTALYKAKHGGRNRIVIDTEE